MQIVEDIGAIASYVRDIARKVASQTGSKVEHVETGRYHVQVHLSDDYKLVFFEHEIGEEFQIRLEPATHTNYLLEFGFGPRRRAKFGLTVDGQVYLLRDTKSLSIGQRQNFNVRPIAGSNYYVVCSLDDRIADEIIRFYEDEAVLEDASGKLATGDYGPLVEHSRTGCEVIPKHHPVAKAAERYLLEHGFELLVAKGCRPDFFAQRDRRKTVVEVKPNVNQQSIATAIGQLLMYRLITSSDEMLLIVPESEPVNRIRVQIAQIDPRIVVASIPIDRIEHG
ncbi:hypothetical protein [Neorhizobium galegae]|uniref:hypothetical protein n=1 Tax=Neorhizobium galegae TaxID=399 RepID=UPI00056F812E|nr:hypothetical protein [Neorhizobium galegae]